MNTQQTNNGHIYFTFMIFMLMSALPFYDFWLFRGADNTVMDFIIMRPGVFLAGQIPALVFALCAFSFVRRRIVQFNRLLALYAIVICAFAFVIAYWHPLSFKETSHYTAPLFLAAALLSLIYRIGNHIERKAALKH